MTEADRKKAQAERQRQAALRSSVIQELRQQYSDAPEEIREKRDFQSERESREELHRCSLVCFISAGRHTKADECAIKWERLWGLCVMQESGIISDYVNIPEHLIWAKFYRHKSSSSVFLFFFVFAGKIMRSQWWCVLTCPNIRRTPKREAWCPCPAIWVASHTSVTSQHWREARADRWAYSDITDLSGWGRISLTELNAMLKVSWWKCEYSSQVYLNPFSVYVCFFSATIIIIIMSHCTLLSLKSTDELVTGQPLLIVCSTACRCGKKTSVNVPCLDFVLNMRSHKRVLLIGSSQTSINGSNMAWFYADPFIMWLWVVTLCLLVQDGENPRPKKKKKLMKKKTKRRGEDFRIPQKVQILLLPISNFLLIKLYAFVQRSTQMCVKCLYYITRTM